MSAITSMVSGGKRMAYALVLTAVFALYTGWVSADPVLSNVSARQRSGTGLLDITYDLASSSNLLSVYVQISTNNGASYYLPASSFTGNGYGPAVSPGTGKQIVWDAGTDWTGEYSTQVWFKLTAAWPPRSEYVLPALAAGSVTFTQGVGYVAANPDGEKLYKHYDAPTARWQIVCANGTQPTLAALTNIVVKSVSPTNNQLAAGNINGWALLDLDAVINGTDSNPDYSGIPGTMPALGGQSPSFMTGQWGYYTTWRSACTPPLAEQFIPFDDPLYGQPTTFVTNHSALASNCIWTQGPANADTRYCFLRKLLLTVQSGETYVDLADDLDFGTLALAGLADHDVTVYLRKPDGTRILIYDDETEGMNTFNTGTGSGGEPGNELRIQASRFNQAGNYYLEIYASHEILSPPNTAPYADTLDSYAVEVLYDSGAPVAWEGWTLTAGRWKIDDYDTTSPYPSGAPSACSPRILCQELDTGGCLFRGNEYWKDYSIETTAGKVQTDNDELRWWVRVNGNGTNSPETSNGYMFFMNAGGGSSLGPDRVSADTIGMTRWVNGVGTTLVSNTQAPLGNVTATVIGGTGNAQADLQSWFSAANPRNSLSNGFTLGNSHAEYYRVCVECQATQISVYVSPLMTSPDDPLGTNCGIDVSRLGITGGNTLKLVVTDTNYLDTAKVMERGKLALQTKSQIAWYDQFDVHALRTNGDRGLRMDAAGTSRVEFVRAVDVVTTNRYEVADDGTGTLVVLDRFGTGYDSSANPPQLSNVDGRVWDDPATDLVDEKTDNFRFKDYRPSLAPGAGIWVDDLDQVPILGAP
ncbi:MAG: hypothetical protein KJ692_13775 [Verrucomicrobia bacterium]|nr:hypothetical protein [Verrucomicrobiota bacterium]